MRAVPCQRAPCFHVVSCDTAFLLPNTSDTCNPLKSKRRPGDKPLKVQLLTSFCSVSSSALPVSAFALGHLGKSSPQSKQSNSCPPATAVSISISLFITRFLGVISPQTLLSKVPKTNKAKQKYHLEKLC